MFNEANEEALIRRFFDHVQVRAPCTHQRKFLRCVLCATLQAFSLVVHAQILALLSVVTLLASIGSEAKYDGHLQRRLF